MKHEQDAQNLDRALSAKPEACHDPALLPFLQTAETLKREAAGEAHLEKDVAARQRAQLISMAESKKSVSPEPATTAEKTERPAFDFSRFNKFFMWSGGLVAVAAVVALAVFLNRGTGPTGLIRFTEQAVPAVGRLIIPEVHAADAFSVVAEDRGKDGVDTTTAFMVSSTVPVTADELKQHLVIVPADPSDIDAVKPPAVTVEDLGGGKFKVRPEGQLSPGKVYRVVIDAAVEKSDGSREARDFTWAVQTRNVFRVISSIPADRSSGVPIKTGIEFEMNQENWDDPSASFSIEPGVKGRFETHGRSLVFVPEQALAYGQLYTVTLKKGLKLKGSDNALGEDYLVRFETLTPEQAKQGGQEPKPIVYAAQDYNQFVVDREAALPLNWWSRADEAPPQVEVTGFGLTQDESVAYLSEMDKIPDFAPVTRGRDQNFAKYAKRQAFSLSVAPEKTGYYGYRLRLPDKLAVGNYLVRLKTQGSDKYAWTFVDVTRALTYTIADDKALLVWAMNVDTERPLGDLPVAYGNTSGRTDQSGVARLPVPEVLTATDTSRGTGVAVKLGAGDLASVIWLRNESRYWGYSWRNESNDKTVSYVYHDRPIYKTTDKLFAYGMVRDRATDRAASGAVLELTKAGYYWDWFTRQEKVYRRVALTTDDQGFFRGEMEWGKLAPGYYQLRVVRDGAAVASHNFEIRDYVKPAYAIDVTLDKRQVFSGEAVTGEARVRFYDGTPVAEMDLNVRLNGPQSSSQAVRTDANGLARFSFKTTRWDCDPNQEWFNCPSSQSLTVEVTPTEGEEAQIAGSAYATVWRGRASLGSYANVKGDQATIKFDARRVDLRQGQAIDSDTVLAEPLRDAKITGRILEETWVEIQTGTRYDYVTKQTYPVYRYERKRREVAAVNLTTGSQGQATLDFAIPSSTASYRLVASVRDENGVEDFTLSYFASQKYSGYNYAAYPNPDSKDTNYYFRPSKEQEDKPGYDVGERVSLSYYQGQEKLQPAKTPVFLYVKAHIGLRDVAVTDRPTYEFDFSQDLVPNVSVRGILFRDGGFYVRDYSAGIDQDLRALTVNVSADKESYAPGSQAKLRVSFRDKAGNPAPNVRLALGVVDESVYAAANNQTGGGDPLDSLYAWVGDGVVLESVSHMANPEEALMRGGAEMGGGGGDQVRRNFKDTADFQTVTADANGQAELTVNLPDNITSWRATLVGISPNLRAGLATYSLKVTKPLFVDAVVPATLLAQDRPVIKLRAYGLALKSGQDVSFQVDAPSLGLKGEKAAGKAYDPVYVAVQELVPGEHALTLRVTSADGSDAMEKKVKVVTTRFAKQEKVQVELGPGVGLPEVGESREVELSFLPKSRAQYLDNVWSLSYGWSQRSDALVAERLAKVLLKEQFNQDVAVPSESLQRFQKPSGGISLLAYSSEDPALTAKVAAAAPDQFDRVAMQAYFASLLEKKGVGREEQLRSLSGLAALGAPVLSQLQDLAAAEDLSWRERLAVMRGLDSLGDQDGARQALESFLAKSEAADGLRFVRVSESKRDNFEATSEAAVVAADLLHPSAPELAAWLEANWAEDAFTPLDKIAYLKKVVPMSFSRDVVVGYTLGADEKVLTLKGGWWGERLVLTADEATKFRVTKADGPAVAVFMREAAGQPRQNPDITLERSYEYGDKRSVQELRENQPVFIKLKVKWGANAQSGCYTLRDHLPAGVSPLVNIFGLYDWNGKVWYPADTGDGAATFVVCNPQDKDPAKNQEEITYKARVVSRGSYLAEPAVLQSNEAPSIAALSQPFSVTVK